MNDPFTVTVLKKERSFSQSYTFHSAKPADIPISICYDDSIKIVKYKILNGLYSNDLDNISYEELYLFAVVDIPFDLLQWYKLMTKNDSIPLYAQTFCQVLTNLAGIGNNDEELDNILKSYEMEARLKQNGIFKYEDIMNFPWFQNRSTVKQKIPLGNRAMVLLSDKQKRIMPIDFLFSTNPYDLLTETKLETWKKNRDIVNMDEELLFHYGHKLLDNKIFVVLATDVFTEDCPPLMAALYYPYLAGKKIDTMAGLAAKKEELSDASRTIAQNDAAVEEFHNTDIFYDVYETASEKIVYSKNGIDSFSFTLENNNYFAKMNVPMESIFQNIHASENVPFMQYYTGKKHDPMLRLYSVQTAKDGKKIPFLSVGVLDQFMKAKTGTTPHISLYVNNGMGYSANDFIEIVLEQNGNIRISGKMLAPMLPELFESWLSGITNPVFVSINDYLQQSGYSIGGFHSLWDPFLRINSLEYTCVFKLSKKLLLEDHVNCLSTILSAEPDDTKRTGNGLYYRYKRVEYFKIMDDEEQFISQLLKNKGVKKDHAIIIKQLQMRYPHYSLLEIQQMMNAYALKYKTTKGRFINRKEETLANGGFPISFEQNQLGSTCTINVSQIDMMPYVFLLPIYLESILQMSQNTVPEKWKQKWDNKNPGKVAEVKFLDIVSNTPTVGPVQVDEDEDRDDDGADNDDSYFNLLEESDGESDDDEENAVQEKKKEEEEEEEEEEPPKKEEPPEEDDMDYSFAGGGKHKNDKPAHYFINRMKDRDKKLYESMEGYENVCEINQKRQPIILTKQEKEEMDSKYGADNKPYTEALEYGKDENNDPYYYICPRFWCTKPGSERVLTEEEAKSGVCGNIIKNLKNPKEGEFVYDRTHDLYKAYVPGFVKDKCYPCCFKNWDKPEQKRLRGQCNPAAYAENAPKKTKDQVLANEKNPFILDYTQTNVTLDHGRFALIPIPIQLFLGINSNKCIEDHYAKENCPVFLRYGVEPTPQNQQSFFACLAGLYSSLHKLRPPMKLQEFREIFIKNLSLDLFAKLQNGALVSRFKSTKMREIDNVNITKYQTSVLYKNIDRDNESQLDFLKYSIASFENFQKYLRDGAVKIDHAFLWDIVARPTPDMFPKGLNLVILEILDHDVTNKVRLVCPTHHYHTPLFDETRDVAIIIKNDDRYELVCRYKRKGNELPEVIKLFDDQQDKSLNDLFNTLKTIKYMVNNQCAPYSSKSSSYKFKTNLHCDIVADLVKKLDTEVVHKVMNYQGKIIALIVNWKKKNYYLPCFPSTSSKLESVPTKWIDDEDMWNNYNDTLAFLAHIHDGSDKKIPSNPVYRIVEDGVLVVGVLTASNQFIPINPPIQNVQGDPIPIMKSSNYIMADRVLSKIQKEEDKPEDKTIKYIYLENEFYNAFRTTLRILMALFMNRKTVEKMSNICMSKDFWYYRKKKTEITRYLKKIGQDYIAFQPYEEDVLMDMHHIFTCKPTDKNKQYCLVEDKKGKTRGILLLPSRHLLTGDDNVEVYYSRLADELIRHRRVQLFMFYPDKYLNIGTQEYSVLETEFIIPKSLLTPDYLKAKRHEYGKFAQNIPYEFAEPSTPAPRREHVDFIKQQEEENLNS